MPKARLWDSWLAAHEHRRELQLLPDATQRALQDLHQAITLAVAQAYRLEPSQDLDSDRVQKSRRSTGPNHVADVGVATYLEKPLQAKLLNLRDDLLSRIHDDSYKHSNARFGRGRR